MGYTIIGIDFGTSTTVIKIKNYYDGMKSNETQSLVIHGNTSVPTQVFYSDENVYYFGREVDAEIQAGTNGITYRNFKMDLIHPDPNKRNKARELTQLFFNFLYEQFDKQRQTLHIENTCKTYVSYPAKWTPEVISFMKQCAINAGFGNENNVFGETEPTAAIYAALTNNEEIVKTNGFIAQNRPINVLMLDMGAGTSDITIFKFKVDNNNKFYIGPDGEIVTHPAIDNEYLCGGREIDEILTKYNESYLEKVVTFRPIPEGLFKINTEGVKEWKETSVSKRLSNCEDVPMPGYLSSSLNMLRSFGSLSNIQYSNINRPIFELTTRQHWTQLHSLITDAIKKATKVINGLSGPEDIDLAIVTGGHSQWYCVKELLLGKSIAGLDPINFEKLKTNSSRILCESRPHETVASGLSYRDLEFNVAHTSVNSLWVKIILNNTVQSELFQPLEIFDTIPCSKNIIWTYSFDKSFLSIEDANIKCNFYYGTEINTAREVNTEVCVSLNNFFWWLLKLPFGIFIREDTYRITVNSTMGQTFARLVRAGLSLIMPIAVGRIWQKPPALFICGNVSKWIRTPFFSFLNGIWRVLAYARSRTLFICGRTWRTTVHRSCARNPCLLRSLTS